MADIKRDIKYINRDFNSLRSTLISYTQNYFPNTYQDFTPSSVGMLFMEMSAYVGDVLSFYLDNQIQETFTTRAKETKNIFALANSMGYKPKVTSTSTANVTFYQKVPAKTSGTEQVPDYDYTLTIPENTRVSTPNGVGFSTTSKVDFSVSSSLDPTEVSILTIDTGTNLPTFFLLSKSVKVIQNDIKSANFSFNNPVKFATRTINDQNIIKVLSIVDSDNNKYYEVDNLSQDVVFDSIKNTNINNPHFTDDSDAPFLLQLKQVQRRFTTRFIDESNLEIQFGAGNPNDTDEEITPNPNNVGLGLPFENNKLTTAFSPVNFVFTNTYGIAPANTTLFVTYLTGGGVQSNVVSNSITSIDKSTVKFNTSQGSNSTLRNNIFAELTCANSRAAEGGGPGDTLTEIKQNTLGNFGSQLRAVTEQDYIIRTLSMPAEFGTVSKVFSQPTQIGELNVGETPSVLDLYILAYNRNNKLKQASSTLKQNLRTYLSQYRMINDSIRIKNAFIINIGVDFDIIVLPNFINDEVLRKCISEVSSYFDLSKWQINEPIILSELYVLLSQVEGVQSVKDIKITNKVGITNNYSSYAYDIDGATINGVIYPSIDPMIFEVKFPTTDIKGRVVPL